MSQNAALRHNSRHKKLRPPSRVASSSFLLRIVAPQVGVRDLSGMSRVLEHFLILLRNSCIRAFKLFTRSSLSASTCALVVTGISYSYYVNGLRPTEHSALQHGSIRPVSIIKSCLGSSVHDRVTRKSESAST